LRLFFSLALALCAVGGARAADFSPTGGLIDHDFAGSYAGLHLGGAWGDLQLDAPTQPVVAIATNAVAGGAHLGYNFVSGHAVFGAEAEFNGSSASGRFVFGGLPGAYAQNWFGSIDARLGWVSGRVLVFALAGYAWSALEGRASANGPSYDGMSAVRNGYAVGGGLEYAFTERFSGRVEYRYYDFGGENFAVASLPAPVSARLAQNVVRAGVSYKFGGF